MILLRCFIAGVLLTSLGVNAADYEFAPAGKKLSVSFNMKTQTGVAKQRIEIRKLLYRPASGKKLMPTRETYLLFYRGKDYGPVVLATLKGHSPLLRKQGNEIRIYYIAGAKTHVLQTWVIKFGIPKKVNETNIPWNKRPK